ncbi:serine protease [Caulobacter sp. FWC2]|nr:serine protease [Caulobacter sp. FWC2]
MYLGVLFALLLRTAANAEPVRYALSPVVENGALKVLAVDIDFKGDADGLTVLKFIDSFQGDTRPGRFAEGLEITGAKSVTPRPEGGALIHAAPGAALHARYRIRSGYDKAPTTQDETQTKPIVLPDWFYVSGELVFAYPEGRRDTTATFRWDAKASGFRFASDLEQLAARHGTVDDMLDSIMIGSPRLRITEGTGADAGLRLAALGAFDAYDDPAFSGMAFRLILAERAFWDDGPTPFLVTLAPLETRFGESYSGAGRSDAFALWVGQTLPLADLRRLLAHEYFHTWNAGQLGRQGPQRRSAWLSEGFTDFYARRLLLRSGVFSLADYVAAWNEDLLGYGVSPARNADEEAIAKGYWQDHALEEVTYKRGALMAALFEAQLRRDGLGLDAVMRAMRGLYRRDPKSALRANFETAFKIVSGRSPVAEIDRHQTRGETLTPADGDFACLTIRTVTQPGWSLGFDPDATAEKGAFAGVDPAGPAYAAGLRDGMKRIKREGGAMNDSSVEIAYTVSDASGGQRVIRYRPEGKGSVSFQRLSIPQDLTPAQEAACVRTLSGL